MWERMIPRSTWLCKRIGRRIAVGNRSHNENATASFRDGAFLEIVMQAIGLNKLIVGAFVGAVVVVAGCSTLPSEPFPPLPPLETDLPVSRAWLRLHPNHFDDRRGALPLHVADKQVIWTDSFGVIVCYDVDNGKILWRIDTGMPISAGVGVDAERLFIGTFKGDVLALDRVTGATVWQAKVSSEVLAPPQASQDVVVVQSNDGKVFGFDAASGRELWRYDSSVPLLTLRGSAAPRIAEDKVVLGLANGKLVGLNLFDGKERWRVEVAVPKGRSELDRMVDVDATPLVVDDVVYAAAFQGRVLAVSLQTGRTLWSRDIASTRGLAVRDGTLYVTADDGALWALNRSNGQVIWRQVALTGREVTAPAISGDYVVVGDGAGFVHWIDAVDGHVLHRLRIDQAPVVYQPQVAAGKVLLVSGAGVVDALTLDDI